jgi:hypothetical protein
MYAPALCRKSQPITMSERRFGITKKSQVHEPLAFDSANEIDLADPM